MKLPWVLFALCFAMCAITGFLYFVDSPPNATGVTHDTYTAMQLGGDGEQRHEHVLLIGYAYGLVIIALFVGLLAFGIRRGGRVGPISNLIALGAVVYVFVFSAMVLSYRHFMLGDVRPFFGAMPRPTAWMLYGLWGWPLIFIVYYVAGFRRYVWSDADEAAFQEILRNSTRESSGS